MKIHSSMKIKRDGRCGGCGRPNARQKRRNHGRMNPDGEDASVDCKGILVPEEGPGDLRPEKRFKGVARDPNGDHGAFSSPEFSDKSRELPREEEEKGEVDTIREERDSGEGASRHITSLCCGSISVMGRRRVMEDALTVAPGVLAGEYDFFATYDGHGGAMVAHACSDRLHQLLEKELMEGTTRKEEKGPTTSTGAGEGKSHSKRDGIEYWTRIMEASFSKMDEEVLAQANQAGAESGKAGEREVGSTAVVVVVGTEEMVVANCGDSRAVLCRGGVALPLSNDHKVSY